MNHSIISSSINSSTYTFAHPYLLKNIPSGSQSLSLHLHLPLYHTLESPNQPVADLLLEALAGLDGVGDGGLVAGREVEKKIRRFLQGEDPGLSGPIGKLG